MRTIKKIVIHHTLVEQKRQPSADKMIQSMNRTHAQRIWQPADANGSTISYHYYIHTDGSVRKTRLHESEWRANSNRQVNREAINIVLHGNFDVEKPKKEQYVSLVKIITELFEMYGSLSIHWHKDFSSKSCPWKNFDFNLLQNMLMENLEAIAKKQAVATVAALSTCYDLTEDEEARNLMSETAKKLRQEYDIDNV